MSQITAEHHDSHGHGSFHSHFGHLDVSPANTQMDRSWGGGLMIGFLAVGVLATAATFFYPSMHHDAGGHGHTASTHMWASYLVGVIVTIGLMLGSLGVTMIFRATQAGWCTSFRRQVENSVSLMPLAIVLVLPLIFAGKDLWHWMGVDPHTDPLLEKKADYLNPTFFWIRIALYVMIWSLLAWRMYRLSVDQDRNGDKSLTNKAQLTSVVGLLLFALTSTFAAFDLVMSLDYHWFSTMFGVYFFAGNTLSAIGLVILVLCIIRSSGKMKGLVTPEHFHDLGKMLIAFTVFWAYIGFSQYFLIWYANIPEETAWFAVRTQNGWETLGKVMMFGHFILPFLLLLWKNVKRTPALLAFFAFWQIAMHCIDIFWLIRPTVYMHEEVGNVAIAAGKIGFDWVDVTGLAGPLCIFLGLLVWRIRSGSLIPLRDPRLAESLNHKNYV